MIGDKKGLAAIILAKAKPKEDAPESEEPDALRMAAEDLIAAVREDDVDGVMSALTAAVQVAQCGCEPDGDEDTQNFAKGGKVHPSHRFGLGNKGPFGVYKTSEGTCESCGAKGHVAVDHPSGSKMCHSCTSEVDQMAKDDEDTQNFAKGGKVHPSQYEKDAEYLQRKDGIGRTRPSLKEFVANTPSSHMKRLAEKYGVHPDEHEAIYATHYDVDGVDKLADGGLVAKKTEGTPGPIGDKRPAFLARGGKVDLGKLSLAQRISDKMAKGGEVESSAAEKAFRISGIARKSEKATDHAAAVVAHEAAAKEARTDLRKSDADHHQNLAESHRKAAQRAKDSEERDGYAKGGKIQQRNPPTKPNLEPNCQSCGKEIPESQSDSREQGLCHECQVKLSRDEK